MKAAIITAPNTSPIFGDFDTPHTAPAASAVSDTAQLITVRAAAITNLTRGRASGQHYSADNVYPSIPGTDGVGANPEGRRVYFALPDPPFGALAELCPVDTRRCIPIPDALDDITAAALANPGMSAWGAMVIRANFKAGETILINGATGSAGRIAVQLAKHLGAGRIIATGRNLAELEKLRAHGADAVIAFNLSPEGPSGAKQFEEALAAEFSRNVDVVIDYLWGQSALSIITAVVKFVEEAHPVRFVQVGSAAGQQNISLPSAALRSSAIQLMGSGLKSIPMPRLLDAVAQIFAVACDVKFDLPVRTLPLSQIAEAWAAPTSPRIVVTI